jgi:DNA-binding transcriptional ArsR family regulator
MSVESRRPQVVDLSRPEQGVALEIDVSEAAELLMSMCAVAGLDELDTLDLGRERVEAVRAAAPPDLLGEVDDLLVASQKTPASLLGVVYETPPPRTLDAFVETLAAQAPVEIRLHFLHYYNPSQTMVERDVIRAAAEGDPGGRARLLEAIAEWGSKRRVVERLLEVPAEELKGRLLEILPRWRDEIFAPHAAEALALAERDAESKRSLARSLPPEEFVERATNGLRYSPPPHIRTIALFPTFWQRPWVVLDEHKHVRIFCYPITVDREERAGGDPRELARVYKALADEGRLRLLRRLDAGPLTLTDAADELGLAKSTAHHHLSILRHAGFVVVRDSEEREYTLRRDLLPQAGDLLAAYLRS